MKPLLILLFSTSVVFGQFNYVELTSSNNVRILVSKYTFLAGRAISIGTTNGYTALTNIDGYLYPSNQYNVTRFPFPSDIVNFTNVYVNLNVLTTNAQVLLGTYRMTLYTNNYLSVPCYDSGRVLMYSNLTSAGTNMTRMLYTNHLTPNFMYSNNVTFGVMDFRLGPYDGASDVFNHWLLSGNIQFQ